MKKKELIERIKEGSPVVIGIPVGKKTRYVPLEAEELAKSLKGVRGELDLPCDTVAKGRRTREETTRWIIFFDVLGIRS